MGQHDNQVMPATESSYRNSHLGRGWDYHKKFQDSRHRAMMWRLECRVLDRVLSNRSDTSTANCLDFACGTGRILHFVAPRVRRVLGVDVSDSMLTVARQSLPSNAEVRLVDLTRDPAALGEERFDLITAFRFFPNAEPQLRDEAMAALASYLAPNGILVFNNHKNAGSIRYRLIHLLTRARVLGRRDVNTLVSKHGLRIVETVGLGTLPFSHRLPGLCMRPLERLERVLSAVPGASRVAENVLFVAQKA